MPSRDNCYRPSAHPPSPRRAACSGCGSRESPAITYRYPRYAQPLLVGATVLVFVLMYTHGPAGFVAGGIVWFFSACAACQRFEVGVCPDCGERRW